MYSAVGLMRLPMSNDDLVAVVFAVYTVGYRHVHAVAVDAAVAYDGCYADEARGA